MVGEAVRSGQSSQGGGNGQDSQDSQDAPSRFTFYKPALVTPGGYLSNFHNLALSFLTLVLCAEDM